MDLKQYSIPVYDGDIEEEKGIPDDVTKLDQQIKSCDSLIVVTPEYNGSIPGILKNVVDWLSRVDEPCFRGRHLQIFAASPGAFGGVRSLWHSRVPFEVLGAHVSPDMMGLPKADSAFDESGKLTDPKTADRIKNILTSFVQLVQKVRA